MNERFSEDNFIEAAKAYQKIKAPSDLRERVLAGAAQAQAASEQSNVVAFQKEGRRAKRSSGKIYRLASLAACLAIMVAALPGWLPDVGSDIGPDDSVAVNPRGVMNGPVDTQPEPDDSAVPDLISENDEPVNPVMPINEPADEPVKEDPVMPAEEPVKEPDVEPQLPEPVERIVSEPAVVPEPEVTEPKPEGKLEEPETEDFAGKSEDVSVGNETAAAPEPEVTTVGSLLPSVLAGNAALSEALSEMEIRLVAAEEGMCTVELTMADSKTAEIMVTKNVENGRWEVTGTEEE